MRKVKYKQRTKSSKKNSRHNSRNTSYRRNNGTRKCKKGETDETIRVRKLTEFFESNNKMYNLLDKKYEDIKSNFTYKKNGKRMVKRMAFSDR